MKWVVWFGFHRFTKGRAVSGDSTAEIIGRREVSRAASSALGFLNVTGLWMAFDPRHLARHKGHQTRRLATFPFP